MNPQSFGMMPSFCLLSVRASPSISVELDSRPFVTVPAEPKLGKHYSFQVSSPQDRIVGMAVNIVPSTVAIC
ncbi:hypothetical protein Syun_020864 [Stephania yunnanensis]|uniref:Uncharacterized protein n=1 Tax=Stephania yunnanensis TaxID=152371 RepID=A0AAP0NNM2_9MAGN